MKNKTLLSEPLGKESLQRYIEIAYKKLKNSVFMINPMLLHVMLL